MKKKNHSSHSHQHSPYPHQLAREKKLAGETSQHTSPSDETGNMLRREPQHHDDHAQHAVSTPIAKKKAFGQHFLRKQSTIDNMISAARIRPEHTILEIGCGDGVLTRALLEQTSCKQVIVAEIDREWADYTESRFGCPRLSFIHGDILEFDFTRFAGHEPLMLVANLPYQISFPLFQKLAEHRLLFENIIVMLQEEVAQKMAAHRGKPYSAMTLFLQYHFDFTLLEKVEPGAFTPPPKVFSRVIEARPKQTLVPAFLPPEFWLFVRACFKFPRQTLKNNLKHSAYRTKPLDETLLALRAQQLTFEDFIAVWETHIAP